MEKNIYQRYIILRNSIKNNNNITDQNSLFENKKIKLNADLLIKLFPLISVFLFLCGATNIGFYYSYYGLNIFMFIENFEIISLNFQFVILLIIETILIIPFIYLLINTIIHILIKITKTKSIDFHKNDFFMFYFWCNISMIIQIVYYYFNINLEDFIHLLKIDSLIILFFAVVYISLERTNDNKSLIIKILFPVLIFGFSILNGIDDAIQNIEANDYIVDFNYNEKYIKTTDNIKFIGKTNKYLFLYNKSQNENLIYETDKISNLRVIINNKKI